MRSTIAASMTRTVATTLDDAPGTIWSAPTVDAPVARDQHDRETESRDDGLGAARGVAVAMAAGTVIWLAIGAGAFALFQLLS